MYMATAQSTIFWQLRIYHSATAHHQIIYLLQIDQLFHHCESSKYLITVHRKILWKLQIPYFIYINDFYCYCAKHNFLATAHLSFSYCASPNYSSTANRKIFHQLKSSKYLLTVHRKIVLQLQIAYLERSYDLYGYCPKPNFFATAHLSFCFCASPNYLSTAHRPIISPLQIV